MLIFEQYHNCCLLPGKRIGQIDEIKWDNRPENLKPVSKRERAANFGKWAEPIPPGRRCMRCGSSKTGINEDGRDHWHKKPGGHICRSCYYKEWRKKHTKPHRVVYEKQHKVCILPWGQIHFINGDKTDIRIKNMMLLRRGGSALLLKPRIPKDRRCDASQEGRICSPAKTTNPQRQTMCDLRLSRGPRDWSKTEDGYVCSLCVTEARRADLKRAKDFDDYLRIVETAKKVLFDPNFKPPDLRP